MFHSFYNAHHKGKTILDEIIIMKLSENETYLLTVKHRELGGYETWLGTNMVEVRAAPERVRMLIGMFNRL